MDNADVVRQLLMFRAITGFSAESENLTCNLKI